MSIPMQAQQPAGRMAAANDPMAPQFIVIGNTEVHMDADGRYCLNDLHRASGGLNKDRPSLYTANKQAQALVAEIAKAGIPALTTVKGGDAPGVYVVREMVFAYAMWISPAFHLQVIRTFDAVTRSTAEPPAAELSRLDILKLAMEAEVGRLEAERKVAIMTPQVEALHRIALTDTRASMCVTDAAKHLRIKPRSILPWLESIKWTHRRADQGRVVAYQDRIDRGYLEHKIIDYDGRDGTPRQQAQVRVTQKGLVKLAHLIETGKGPA